MSGFMKEYPQNTQSATEDTISIAAGNETENEIDVRIVHENPNVENGYAVLFLKATGNSGDTITPKIKYYGGSSVGDTSGFTLRDPDNNTNVSASASGAVMMVHLNRQKHWGMSGGFKITFTKTGTNDACTVHWRVYYR